MTTNMTPANAIFAPLTMLRTLDEDTARALATLIDALADQLDSHAIPSLERALARFEGNSPMTAIEIVQDAIDRL